MAQLYIRRTNAQEIMLERRSGELDQGLQCLLIELVKPWLSLWRGCFDHYRPEQHYMRGPGPRWREKHERAVA